MDPLPKDDFELPVFDAPMLEPGPVGYERAIREFDELIAAYRLREVPRKPQDVPEFKM